MPAAGSGAASLGFRGVWGPGKQKPLPLPPESRNLKKALSGPPGALRPRSPAPGRISGKNADDHHLPAPGRLTECFSGEDMP